MEHGAAVRLAGPSVGLLDTITLSAAALEAAGLHSLFVEGDRESAAGAWDGYLVLQAFARATSQVRLSTTGDLLSVRSAAVRGKQVASLDWFADGRLDYSVDIDPSPAALRDPFLPEESDELAATLEQIAALSALWTQDRAVHHGERIEFDGAIAKPKPTHGPAGRPAVLVRSSDPARLRAWISGGGHLDGLLLTDVAAGDIEPLVVASGLTEGARVTWIVPAGDIPAARTAASDLGVTELVARFDHLPTSDELARLSDALV